MASGIVQFCICAFLPAGLNGRHVTRLCFSDEPICCPHCHRNGVGVVLLSIEVGMQNSGLGSSLAKADKFRAQFASPEQALLAPVPCAISALYHCIIGSVLAGIWRLRSTSTERGESDPSE